MRNTNKGYVTCHEFNGKKHKVAKKDLVFRPSVYAVVIEKNKVLLSPQWDGYDFPGGGMELGETVDETLEREVWEETGLKVKRQKVLAVETDFFIAPYSRKKFHTILAYFLCKKVAGKLSAENLDSNEKAYAKKAQWVDIKKINKLKFYNGVDSVKVINQAVKWISRS